MGRNKCAVTVTATVTAVLSLVLASPAWGEDEYEWESTLVHSDLPLYDFDWDDLWPRGFVDENSFGCVSRVSFGDWQFIPDPANEYGIASWRRFTNYGVFHCAANIRTAKEQGELDNGDFSRGFFARIGYASKGGKKVELWVLQQGLIPGSDYSLLVRPAEGDGNVKEFGVLQSRCPRSMLRESRNFDIWTTRYCSINDRDGLLRFAQRMLKEPELGKLRLVPGHEGPETEVSDPSEDQVKD